MKYADNFFRTVRDLILRENDLERILHLTAVRGTLSGSAPAEVEVSAARKLHVHDELEIRFLFEHGSSLRLNSVSVIPTNTPHTALTPEELERHLSLLCNNSEFYCMRGTQPVAVSSLKADEFIDGFQVTELFKALENAVRQDTCDIEYIRILLAAILTVCHSRLDARLLPKEYHQAELIATYIQANYFRKDLTISEIAEYHKMSANYIQKVFRAYWNCTPVQFLNNVRLEAAKIMLRQHHWRVKEVAFMCGWNYAHYFCKKYKERFGCNPSDE